MLTSSTGSHWFYIFPALHSSQSHIFMQQLSQLQNENKERKLALRRPLSGHYYQLKVNNYDVGVARLALQAIDSLSIGSQFAIHILRRQQAKKICIKLLSSYLSFKLVKS